MSGIESLAIAAIAGILFVCIWMSLKRSFLFSGTINAWVSLCVTGLCVIAMFGLPNTPMSEQSSLTPSELATDPKPSSNTPWDLPTLLIPYAALGISILTVLIFILISKLWGFLTKGKKASAVSIDRLVAKQRPEVRRADESRKRKKEPALENQDNMSDRKYK